MPKRPKRQSPANSSNDSAGTVVEVDLRIIGGKFRGSRLAYGAHGGTEGLVTRPMKHRVREAIFNLVGTELSGKLALDLFAGTGALGLEAISRGAERALFIEKHVPSANVVKQNIAALHLDDRCELRITSAMLWGKRDLPTLESQIPWAVFFSPPYRLFVEQTEEMLQLIAALQQQAPSGSLLIIEADERFDFQQLEGQIKQTRHDDGWDIRTYQPAVVGVWRVNR